MKVREGSNILALDPAPAAPRAAVSIAYARVGGAARALAGGDLAAANLDDDALDHARRLSDLAQAKDGPVPLRLWVCYHPIAIGSGVADLIREETRPAYHDFGSIEGTLNAIQDARGRLQLKVLDPLWRRAITCHIPEGMLADAMQLFRQRVELFGEIHYRKDD